MGPSGGFLQFLRDRLNSRLTLEETTQGKGSTAYLRISHRCPSLWHRAISQTNPRWLPSPGSRFWGPHSVHHLGALWGKGLQCRWDSPARPQSPGALLAGPPHGRACPSDARGPQAYAESRGKAARLMSRRVCSSKTSKANTRALAAPCCRAISARGCITFSGENRPLPVRRAEAASRGAEEPGVTAHQITSPAQLSPSLSAFLWPKQREGSSLGRVDAR